MRAAEIATALGLAALALVMMSLATALPIGWERSGPGGGAFPFWLSAGMLLCGLWIAAREGLAFWRTRDRGAPFVALDAVAPLAVAAGSLTATVAAIPFVGAYVAIPAFLLFYLKAVAKQSWTLTLIMALATPVAVFFFFEVTLKILLPKGVTEPWFFPLYAIFF